MDFFVDIKRINRVALKHPDIMNGLLSNESNHNSEKNAKIL
jgi:hypothetical protein